MKLLALLFLFSLPALASAEKIEACKKESEKFCKGITREDPKFQDCLRGHLDELSQVCIDSFESAPPKFMRKKWLKQRNDAAKDTDTEGTK